MSNDALTIEDVRRMSPEAIRDALDAGDLSHLLGQPSRAPQHPPLDPDAVEKAAADDRVLGTNRLGELLERHRNWTPSLRERVQNESPEEIRRMLHAGELDAALRGERE